MSDCLVVTVCSTKGGVGKTTLTANLGAILIDLGQRVLLIDADIQPTLSSYFPLDRQASGGLSSLLTTADIGNAISRATIGCDIVISDDPDGQLENWILHTPDGRVRLKHALARLSGYDMVLIDTQGAVGPLQDCGILAADCLISPIPPDILSAREFARGMLRILERLRPMQFLGAPVGHLHGLLYRVDRTRDATQIAAELRREAGSPGHPAFSILKTQVPATVAYREAATARMPIHLWEPHRTGPTPSGRETMLSLVRELLPHLDTGLLAGLSGACTGREPGP